MISKINSCIVLGVQGLSLDIEVDISSGLPSFSTVGLPDSSVRESKERVKAAIKNSGYTFPNRRITVNLAPADIKKEGACYDLPIALGILLASIGNDNLAQHLYSVSGELSLDGQVRNVKGVLPMALHAAEVEKKGIIVPEGNKNEAALVRGIDIIPVKNLHEAFEFVLSQREIVPYSIDKKNSRASSFVNGALDMSEIKGQHHAKRGLLIAAAGNHNVFMKGPPGSGKSMLAKRLPTIMPDLSFEETVETTKIHSIAGLLTNDDIIVEQRPFRSPHHTISDAGLIGGGSNPRPGEVSLAHNGILFLDELTEFRKGILEMLRQPLEDKKVTIARANMSLTYPSEFLLVGAYNPCPCGYSGDKHNRCICAPTQIQRYISKLSGPLLDRIDIFMEMAPVEYSELQGEEQGVTSANLKIKVDEAKEIQRKRFVHTKDISSNSMMTPQHIEKFCQIDNHGENILQKSMDKLGLSARGVHRILKLARTIADLDLSESILSKHVAEAVQYRRGSRIEDY